MLQIFADDTKIYSRIRSDDDIERLQGDIDKLFEWSMTWRLLFNAGKCVHMHVDNGFASPQYTMKSDEESLTTNVIKSSICGKDLGVFIYK